MEGSCVLCVQTLLVFAHYSGYILKCDPRSDLAENIALSELNVCSFFSLLGLVASGTSASVSVASGILSVIKGIMVLIPLLMRSHMEQYNLFAFLHERGYDMGLGFHS